MRYLLGILSRAKYALALAAVFATAAVAQANSPPNYGNLTGPNIMYLGVKETVSQFGAPPVSTLYGDANLAGDDLVLGPGNFSLSQHDGGVAFQDGRLDMTIQALNSLGLGKITVAVPSSGYGVIGGTPGNTFSQESLILPSIIANITGGSGGSITINPTMVFTDSNGLGGDTIVGESIKFNPTKAGFWSATGTYDIVGALAAAGKTGKVTSISLSIDDQLFAQSQQGSFAMIDKKGFSISVTPVPEPSAIILGLMGGVGLLLGGRRLRKAKTA